MQKKKVYYFLLLCCPLFYFCSDHPDVVDYESMQSKEPELLGAAKALLKSCGDAIPLSDLSGDKENGVSSRGLGHPTNSVPLWDESIQLPEFNGEEILLVPLKEEKKRYAYAKIKKGNEISRQFSTSFSRLIVRKKGGRTIAHVFTYLPERKYVKANRTRLDSLKYHPEEVGYEGFVLISSLNGTFKHGFLYEDGKATVRLTYGHQHTDDCTSCSHTEGSDADVRFNISFCTETLKSRGYSRGVEDDSEAYICSFCGQPVDDCVCLTIEGEYIYCDGCGMLQGQCVCDLLVCPTCNDYPCTCFDYSDYCSICGSDPCTCSSGDDEYCSVCGESPCQCPIEYCIGCGREIGFCVCCSTCKQYPCICNTIPCRDAVQGKSNPLIKMELEPPYESNIAGATFGKTRNKGNKFHQGIDLAADVGTPIYAMFGGTVTKVVTEQPDRINKEYPEDYDGDTDHAGNRLYISSVVNNKTILVAYWHLQAGNPVAKKENGKYLEIGDRVSAGDVIAYVGISGNSNPEVPHLHLGVKIDGIWTNPTNYLNATISTTNKVIITPCDD